MSLVPCCIQRHSFKRTSVSRRTNSSNFQRHCSVLIARYGIYIPNRDRFTGQGSVCFNFKVREAQEKSQLVTDDSKHSKKKSKLDLGPFLMDWSTVFSDKSWISFEILFNPMESLFYPSDSSILIHRISKNFSTISEFQFGYDN